MPQPSAAAAPVRSYRDLRVWQQAMDLAEATYRATEQFPEEERYGLVTQLRRATVSVASNIAEGHARSTGDYLRHLLISNGYRLPKLRRSYSSAPGWGFSQRSWRTLCCRHATRSAVCWAASGRVSEPGAREGLGVRG